MAVEFAYLADHPHHVKTVIDWWSTVWADRMGTREDAIRQLESNLSTTDLPIHILAFVDGEAAGSAALKTQELGALYPDRQYWLGSVFVDPAFRGNKLASQLSEKIAALAVERHLPHLHLQTINTSGGLYAKLGWQAIEEFDYRDERTLLMIRPL